MGPPIMIIFIHQHSVVDNKTKICKTVTGLYNNHVVFSTPEVHYVLHIWCRWRQPLTTRPFATLMLWQI